MLENRELLEMALVGYRVQVQALSEKITAIEIQLRGEQPGPALVTKRKKKRHMTPEGRARISAAAKKRWAKIRRAA